MVFSSRLPPNVKNCVKSGIHIQVRGTGPSTKPDEKSAASRVDD